MNEFCLVGGEIITPDEEHLANLYVRDGQLSSIHSDQAPPLDSPARIDVSGCYVTPGLIDLQVNGTPACNLWAKPGRAEFWALCRELLGAGVTTFLPTLITADLMEMKDSIACLESFGVGTEQLICSSSSTADNTSHKKLRLPASLSSADKGMAANGQWLIRAPGIHLEGPFLSPQRFGAHPEELVRPLNIDSLKELIRPSIKLVTLAPEQRKGEAAVRYLVEKGVTVSLGHSNATFAEAEKAFGWGVRMITHTFNALPPLHHRAPGAVGAALLNDDVWCCVICDGLHVDREMVRLLVRIKGVDRVILVTDVAPVGTAGGGLFGSSILLAEAVRNMVNWQVASFSDAIKMATLNPARAIKLDEQIGSIKEAAPADLVVWDKDTLEIKHVVANGNLVF